MINHKLFKYKIESLIIILIPLLLIFSRFLLEISLLYLSISYLIILKKKKIYSFLINDFAYVFFGFYLILIFSYALSEFKEDTFTIIFYFRYFIYISALTYFFHNDLYLIKSFFTVIGITILILLFDSSLQFFMGENIFGFQNQEKHRVTSFFDDEKILGSYSLKMLTLLIFAKLFISETSKRLHVLFNISIITIPILVFLSGERAALFALFLMVFYFSFYLYKDKKFKILYKSSIILFSLILVFLINSKTYYDRYINNTLSSIFDANYSQNKHQLPEEIKSKYKYFFLSAQHQNYLNTSLNIYNQNKITGSGPKSFRYACKDEKVNINIYSCGTHPHNYYFQLLSETGIIGFVYILLIYLYIIFKSFINFKNLYFKKEYSFYELTILGYFFVQFWPINQTANLFNNYNSIFMLIPISIYMSLNIKKKDKIL